MTLDQRSHRIEALKRLINEPEPLVEYDRIVRLARQSLGFPYAWFSLLDAGKEWFKATAGLERHSAAIEASLVAGPDLPVKDGVYHSYNSPDAKPFLKTLFPGRDIPVYTYYAVAVHSPEGEVVGTLALLDIREHKLNEAERQQFKEFAELVERELSHRLESSSSSTMDPWAFDSRYSLKKSLALSGVGVWRWEIASGKLTWSAETSRIMGFSHSEDEVCYDDFISLVHPEDALKVHQAIADSLNSDRDYDVEHRIIQPSGEVCWVQNKGGVVKNASGKAVQMMGIVVDINRRKALELDFQRNESKFRSLFEMSPIGIALNDMNGRFIGANQAFLSIVGYSLDELQALSYWDLTPQCFSQDEAEQLALMKESGRYGPYEKQYFHKSGELVDVRLNGVLIEEPYSQSYIWSLVEDITQSKLIKGRMEHAHDLLLQAQKQAKLGHWEANLATGELFWSETIFDIFGFDSQSFSPSVEVFKNSIHPDDMDLVEASEARARETGKHDVVHRIIRPDGEVRYVREIASLVEDKEGQKNLLIGTVQDISELQRAEHFLDLFQKVFDSSQQGLGIADKQGHLVYTNAAHDILHGYEPGELVGQHISRFFSEENKPWILDAVEQAGQVEMGWSGLIPIQLKNGRERMTLANINVVKNRKGEVEYVFNVMSDYTPEQQRQEALLRAKTEAERASRAKSEFLSNMSHELRTPMNAVLGFAQLLQYDEQLNKEQQEAVKEIVGAGHHLLELINDVLDLSKVEAGKMEMDLKAVNLDKVILQALDLIQPLAQVKSITIEVEVIPDQAVMADSRRLKQVLLNLLSNAVKYNQPGGQIRLEAKLCDQREKVCLSVVDNGMGIPKDQLQALFQPFNRLGQEASGTEGTGIGLSLSHKLIEQMGGQLGVRSELGQGSEFWFELPLQPTSESEFPIN